MTTVEDVRHQRRKFEDMLRKTLLILERQGRLKEGEELVNKLITLLIKEEKEL